MSHKRLALLTILLLLAACNPAAGPAAETAAAATPEVAAQAPTATPPPPATAAPAATPTPAPTFTPTATATPTQVEATPTPTLTATPAPTETPAPTATEAPAATATVEARKEAATVAEWVEQKIAEAYSTTEIVVPGGNSIKFVLPEDWPPEIGEIVFLNGSDAVNPETGLSHMQWWYSEFFRYIQEHSDAQGGVVVINPETNEPELFPVNKQTRFVSMYQISQMYNRTVEVAGKQVGMDGYTGPTAQLRNVLFMGDRETNTLIGVVNLDPRFLSPDYLGPLGQFTIASLNEPFVIQSSMTLDMWRAVMRSAEMLQRPVPVNFAIGDAKMSQHMGYPFLIQNNLWPVGTSGLANK